MKAMKGVMLLLFMAAMAQGVLPASYPKVKLLVYSDTVALYSEQTINFDISGSTFSNQTNTYYVLFNFNETDPSTRKTRIFTDGPLNYTQMTSYVATYTYNTVGVKTVYVMVNDRPFTQRLNNSVANSDRDYIGVMSNGLPAAYSKSTFEVLDKYPDCYTFVATDVNWGVHEVLINFRLKSYLQERNDVFDIAISQTYNALGLIPLVTLKNETFQNSFQFAPYSLGSNNTWSVSIPMNNTLGVSTVFVEFKANDIIVLKCGVVSSFITLVKPARFSVGYKVPQEALRNYSPKYFNIKTHMCELSKALVPLSDEDGVRGGMILYTDDSFETNYMIDLTRDGNGVQSLSSDTICSTLSQNECSTLEIYHAEFFNAFYVYLTNKGLFYSKSINGVHIFQKLDLFNSTNFRSDVSIYATADCEILDSDLLFVRYETTTATVIYKITSLKPLKYSTTQVNRTVFSVIHKVNINRTLILTGERIGVHSNCYQQLCTYDEVILYSTSFSNDLTLEFEFDEDVVGTGMFLHQNKVDIFMHGNELYQSFDGRDSFYEVLDMDSENPLERIKTFASSALNGGAYCFVTNFNRLFFGRIAVNKAYPILRLPPYETVSYAIYMDINGDTFVIIKQKSQPLKKIMIPIKSYYVGVDASPPANLVPILSSKYTLQFVAFRPESRASIPYDDNSWSFFNMFFVNVDISNAKTRTPMINLQPYPSTMSATKGSVVNPIVYESAIDSPVVRSAIIVKVTSYNARNLPYGLIIESDGFLYSDRGKAIVVGGDSILLTFVYNSTVAEAIFVHIHYGLNFPRRYAAGSWMLVNFRGFQENARVNNQILTLQVSNGIYTASLTNGELKWQGKHEGMFLQTQGGFGVIEQVLGDYQAVVRSFTLNTSAASVLRMSEWSLYEVDDKYMYGETVLDTYKKRAWNIRPAACKVKSISTSLNFGTIFIDQSQSFIINITYVLQGNKKFLLSRGLVPIIDDTTVIDHEMETNVRIDTVTFFDYTVTLKDKGKIVRGIRLYNYRVVLR
jgi:hypothetical protein